MILLEMKTDTTVLTAIARIPTYSKNWFDVLALSRMLSNADRISTRLPFERVPYSTRYSESSLVSVLLWIT